MNKEEFISSLLGLIVIIAFIWLIYFGIYKISGELEGISKAIEALEEVN